MTDINGVAVLEPLQYEDVSAVADAFMQARPVLVDLREVDVLLARRITDFCSGLTYGERGSAEDFSSRVLLLSPHGKIVPKTTRGQLTFYLTENYGAVPHGDLASRIATYCRERHDVLIGPVTAEQVATQVLPHPGISFELIGADPDTGSPKKILANRDDLQAYLDNS